MDPLLLEKKEKLYTIIRDMGGCVVGFSGGVDSTLLFAVAAEVLGNRALAVTATSETYPERELREASEFARRIGGRHRVVESEELDIPGFAENPKNRCYYCKSELFTKLRKVADEEGLPYVLDGSNLDDRGDYRPGKQAACESNVRSPLDEAGLSLPRPVSLPYRQPNPCGKACIIQCQVQAGFFHSHSPRKAANQSIPQSCDRICRNKKSRSIGISTDKAAFIQHASCKENIFPLPEYRKIITN